MALEFIKCPHCGTEFKIDIEKQLNEGETTATRSIWNSWRQKNRHRIKAVDIKCTKCERIFEYEVKS